jgi:phage regulator Rha-like protein
MKTNTALKLVEVKGQKVFTTSLIVAKQCDNRSHESTIKLIRKYQSDFEEFAPLGFEIHVATRKQGGGTALEYVELTEDQATLLITYFKNTPTVRKFKISLIKAFRRALDELAAIKGYHSLPDWQIARMEGKESRLKLTDAVKLYEAYADQQGGSKIDKDGNSVGRNYYSNITKLVYKELFGDRTLKDVRGRIDRSKLNLLSVCEDSMALELHNLILQGIEYHEIYKILQISIKDVIQGLSKTRITGENTGIRLIWDSREMDCA